ncbi:winged helix-turn-helix transcriptional regulator [Micromonospora azadirachtae]|uniref:Winged helix-turn-helix transcriptional regulator n=1 Tax=Micromonospora azadirachtae TaxID=1970735 RepID=A0ABW2ZVN2_9ACTN
MCARKSHGRCSHRRTRSRQAGARLPRTGTTMTRTSTVTFSTAWATVERRHRRHLEGGPLRYTELIDCIPGNSQRMLTLTLQQLTRPSDHDQEAP